MFVVGDLAGLGGILGCFVIVRWRAEREAGKEERRLGDVEATGAFLASLQRACSRAASVYSAPKGTFCATL